MTIQTPIRAQEQSPSLDQMLAYYQPAPFAARSNPPAAPRDAALAALEGLFGYYDAATV